MSFFYALHMETDVKPLTALSMVAQHLPFQWRELPNSKEGLRGSYSALHAASTFGEYSGIKARFGFDPCLYIGIEEQSAFEQYHQGLREIMSVIVMVLKHLKGDAVVLENGGPLLLQRLGGQLTLSAIPFAFPEYQQTLDLITLPYDLQELPYLGVKN